MSVVREAERARRDAVRDRRRQRLVLLHELAEEVYWNAHNGNTAGWMWARNRLRVAMVGIQPGDA
jgi:G:T/U-mismatch repair DNA glycosylase